MIGIPVEELISKFDTYMEGVAYIEKQIAIGKLAPVKSSGFNGKRPPLYQRYRKIKPKKDLSSLVVQADRTIQPPLSAAFYKKHPALFEQDQNMVYALQDWLLDHPIQPEMVSCNERSFDIFGQEKILAKHGERLCKNLGINLSALAFYQTCEPLSVASKSNDPGNLLIVENLDPFVSIRNLLQNQKPTILGFPLQSVAYGAGRRIESTFMDLLQFGSQSQKQSLNPVYYWGDLDYEGIRIYESFVHRYPQIKIVPWIPGYQMMLKEANKLMAHGRSLPSYKEGQLETQGRTFFSYFDEDFKDQIQALWKQGLYIPQEILNARHYAENESQLLLSVLPVWPD